MKTYTFVREDNGQDIEVDFETMMGQDVAGFIHLPDGTAARRKPTGSARFRDTVSQNVVKPIPPSDAMGFTKLQLAEFEADRVAHGFTGVEFTPDPQEPTFYQVRCADRRTWEKYVAHRGLVDNNRTAAVSISVADLEAAKRRFSGK